MIKKLKLKRGLEENRSKITPDDGEILITKDTLSIYVGDGITPGGKKIKSGLTALEWNFTTTSGVSSYSPVGSENGFHDPLSGIYIVFYSSVKLLSSDYTINHENNTITLTTPPTESGTSISIYYIGE